MKQIIFKTGYAALLLLISSFCCNAQLTPPFHVRNQYTMQNYPEQRYSDPLRTLDEIPDWIYENIKFPEKAYQYGIAGIEQFVISATWDGRVFITSGLNTLNPAFEEEIKDVVSKAPRCRFAGNSIEDIYKLVKIDFTAYIPDDLPSSIQCVGRHLPPRFTLRGERMQNLKGKELFVKWISSKFRLPKKYNLTNYSDTISLYYTITEDGKLKNPHVEGCKNIRIQTELEKLMASSPQWQAAITDGKMPIPVSIKDRIIVRTDEHGKNVPFEIYTDSVCRNSTSTPTDPNMIVLNPEKCIQYIGENKSFVKVIRDSLTVEKKVNFVGSFVVEKNGAVSNIHTETTDSIADGVITALIKQSKWVPAQQGGKPVRAIYAFVGTKLPPAKYVYAVPPRGKPQNFTEYNSFQEDEKARWAYFKKAYPQVNAVIHGSRKFRFLSSDDYKEALIMRGLPVVEIKKYKVTK